MTIHLYDTLTREKREFKPRRAGEVSLYVCGVTPYSYTHVGHARVSVFWDVVRRYLMHLGFRVKFVQNFTDVDDKIIKRAQEEGLPAWKLAQRYIEDYDEVMAQLLVAPADLRPRVSTEIESIKRFIARLVRKGHAYQAGGDVFYAVDSFPGYGKLSRRSVEELEAGARVEVNPLKRHPMDFALWKAAKPGEPAWPSPWGPGRPGWHIECSAMSMRYLGAEFDIHGGGLDLVFPHHENEVAQSEAYSGRPLARFWVHNGLVNVADEKMSKSLGNTFAVRDVLKEWDPLTLRYFLLSAHYRSPLTYSQEELRGADAARRRLVEAYRAVSELAANARGDAGEEASREVRRALETAAGNALREFSEAMDDDLNTALALAALHTLAREVNRQIHGSAFRLDQETGAGLAEVQRAFVELDGILRIFGEAEAGAQPLDAAELDEAQIEALLAERQAARAAKDWARADRLRDELAALGVIVEDTPYGPRWKRAPR